MFGKSSKSKSKSSKSAKHKSYKRLFAQPLHLSSPVDQEMTNQVSLLHSNIEYADTKLKIDTLERDEFDSSGSSFNYCLPIWISSFAIAVCVGSYFI